MSLRPVPSKIDPDDPLYAVVQAVERLQTQSVAELGGLVRKLSADIAATAVTAEKAAQVKAELVVTQAGEWAAKQIRQAGEDAVKAIAEQRDELIELKQHVESHKHAVTLLTICLFTAVIAVLGVEVGLLWYPYGAG